MTRKTYTPLVLYCDTCRAHINVVDGVTAIWQRGYWWCARCVQVDRWEDGEPIVAFPSVGKLCRQTIMEEP